MPGELQGPGRIVRLGNGQPIEVDTRDLVGGFIARHGWWEAETVAFLQRWLRPGMTVIDAGAHVGQYALLASGCVGAEGRVHAFEPHPRLHAILCRNLARVGCTNVAAQPLALGRTCEERPFFLARTDNLGASSLRPDPLDPDASAVRVQVTSLDAYLAAHAVPRVDLLKIDVEGAERDLLAGAATTLAANLDIVLVVEFLRENAERWGHTIEALETELRAYGFRLFVLSGLGLAPYTPVGRLAVNVVAARHVTRVLSGVPEPLAAQLLMRLCDATGARRPRPAAPQAKSEVRYVISRRTAGIGDLLVNLLAAWRFAAYTGRTLVADWRFSPYVQDRRWNLFPALFEPLDDFEGVPLIADDRVTEMTFPAPLHPAFWTPARLEGAPVRPYADLFADRDAAVALIRAGGDVPAPTVVFDACINDALPPGDDCRRVLAALRPVAEVREKVGAYRDHHLAGRPLVAVHVRHQNGALLDDTHRQYWTDVDAAIRRCALAAIACRERLGPDATVFLSTDSGLAVEAFRAHVPDALVRPKFFRKDGSGELHQWPLAFATRTDALVDMLLLAAGDALVRYPPHSFFSFYASLMKPAPRGPAPPEVPGLAADPLAPAIVW